MDKIWRHFSEINPYRICRSIFQNWRNDGSYPFIWCTKLMSMRFKPNSHCSSLQERGYLALAPNTTVV